jgi:hypothetical protein
MVKDPVVSALHIKVDTDDKGVVQLSGNAKSQAEADKAVAIAKKVEGVLERQKQHQDRRLKHQFSTIDNSTGSIRLGENAGRA